MRPAGPGPSALLDINLAILLRFFACLSILCCVHIFHILNALIFWKKGSSSFKKIQIMNNKHFPKFLHSNQFKKVNIKVPSQIHVQNVGSCLKTKSMMHNSLSSLTFIYIYICTNSCTRGWGGGNKVSLRNWQEGLSFITSTL